MRRKLSQPPRPTTAQRRADFGRVLGPDPGPDPHRDFRPGLHLGLPGDKPRFVTGSQAARRGRALLFLVGAALTLSLLACNEVDAGAEVPENDLRAGDDSAPSAAAFSWPDDPSHPVLEVIVESPDASGTILIELMPELAPATVVKVIELANEGYYDGTTFHRVIPDFMIQGGDPRSRDRDPTNDGRGDPGRQLHDEFGAAPFMRGVVGMGNKGRTDSTSTQFFIMQTDNESLEGRYTAIGRVLDGIELVDAITRVEIDGSGRWGPKDRPIENVVMTKVRTIGQVAAIRATLEPERDAPSIASSRIDANPSERADRPAPDTSGSPAALASDVDWQRLEASGR